MNYRVTINRTSFILHLLSQEDLFAASANLCMWSSRWRPWLPAVTVHAGPIMVVHQYDCVLNIVQCHRLQSRTLLNSKAAVIDISVRAVKDRLCNVFFTTNAFKVGRADSAVNICVYFLAEDCIHRSQLYVFHTYQLNTGAPWRTIFFFFCYNNITATLKQIWKVTVTGGIFWTNFQSVIYIIMLWRCL